MTLLHPPSEHRRGDDTARLEYIQVVDAICRLNWQDLSREDMISAAWAYYYFSIQFRENLRIARSLYPEDQGLARLEQEECDTSNLSPWPGVADAGEKMNHDEYMLRTVRLLPIAAEQAVWFATVGEAYLADMRRLDAASRAASIASYEDGGLEKVFRAILTFPRWDNALLQAFEHFLAEHVRFDSDPDEGHGSLSRRIILDDSVLPLWQGFKHLLLTCVPSLAGKPGRASTDRLEAAAD